MYDSVAVGNGNAVDPLLAQSVVVEATAPAPSLVKVVANVESAEIVTLHDNNSNDPTNRSNEQANNGADRDPTAGRGVTNGDEIDCAQSEIEAEKPSVAVPAASSFFDKFKKPNTCE